jgi:hypothetical protein
MADEVRDQLGGVPSRQRLLPLAGLIDVPLPIGFVVLPFVLGTAAATEIVELQPPFSAPVEL